MEATHLKEAKFIGRVWRSNDKCSYVSYVTVTTRGCDGYVEVRVGHSRGALTFKV